jgi:hypothetical protein
MCKHAGSESVARTYAHLLCAAACTFLLARVASAVGEHTGSTATLACVLTTAAAGARMQTTVNNLDKAVLGTCERFEERQVWNAAMHMHMQLQPPVAC